MNKTGIIKAMNRAIVSFLVAALAATSFPGAIGIYAAEVPEEQLLTLGGEQSDVDIVSGGAISARDFLNGQDFINVNEERPGINIAIGAEATTSFVSGWETLSAVNDGKLSTKSNTPKEEGLTCYGSWGNTRR